MEIQIGEKVKWTVLEPSSTPKKDLREAVKAAIRANPNHYAQGSISCGTEKCVAGWADHILTGKRFGPVYFERMVVEMGVRPAGDTMFYSRLFQSASHWPASIQKLFYENEVEGACAAIDYYAIED